MTTFLLDSSVCRLVQHPVQIFIALRGATAMVLFGAFVFSGTGPPPKKSIPPLREMYWLAPPLLRRDKCETHECRGGAAKETTVRHLVLFAPIVVHACFTAAMISCWRAFTNGAECRLVQRKERPRLIRVKDALPNSPPPRTAPLTIDPESRNVTTSKTTRCHFA
jgi:hypothetical protein